jgi:hypothetical protein
MVACTVATKLGNLSCGCAGGSPNAANNCTCPTLGHAQFAKNWLDSSKPKLSGIRRAPDSPLLGAVADLAKLLGLTSE